ncbi:2-C-methyl-D-erythritol 4-phosphate cytidylyltransferase [Ruminiclostridium cellulolyticum]|uniref:2-C-methyl-D-erythritol 4-phosphate cytidylyltransferase n=1 Tax=Ruminiclostridium cellulolyticum (strain ATCC 35319 / DSM 5812 / JCM 6584 / H10) TaxID=394503 RepID=B8I5R1_RUMCH|nr:2-C-methyl-D-erythritol 4-phosphate cytidylyltransferase [Ruminiclostridium cellulolyticum H10]
MNQIIQSEKVTAIITAAGKGTRMKSSINKQYIEIAGVPVLARTISAFENCSEVDNIILVVNEEDINFCKNEIVEEFNFTKVISLVSGGAERQNSVYKGLCSIRDKDGVVLIHDGARPFVTNENIVDCINAVREYGACGIGVRSKDTIKISDENGFVQLTPDRSSLWSIQTPQGFMYEIIKNAHDKAVQNGYIGTDDMVLVEKLGIPVKIVEGNYQNIKITTPEDLIMGESLLSSGK